MRGGVIAPPCVSGAWDEFDLGYEMPCIYDVGLLRVNLSH